MGQKLSLKELEKSVKSSRLDQNLERKVLKKVDGIRSAIIRTALAGSYSDAREELRIYQEVAGDLETFHARTSRYFSYCEELLDAIESKYKFSQRSNITRSQKEELLSSINIHYRQLSHALTMIEKIGNDIKIEDVRSTIWVLKAFSVSFVSMIIYFSLKEATLTLGRPIDVVLTDTIDITLKYFGL